MAQPSSWRLSTREDDRKWSDYPPVFVRTGASSEVLGVTACGRQHKQVMNQHVAFDTARYRAPRYRAPRYRAPRHEAPRHVHRSPSKSTHGAPQLLPSSAPASRTAGRSAS
eukprot:scaffold4278_cov263-Pinguiococcus_pyrenoidosus.AAC.10